MTIRKDNGKFYVYLSLESGNSVCIGVFDTKRKAQELIDGFKKAA